MNRSFLLACIACAALLVSAVQAADDDNTDLFNRLDANHDGQIAADEVPQEHRQLFDRLLRRADRNGDGKLSRDEFTAGLAGDQPGRPVERLQRPQGPDGADRSSDDGKLRNYAASIMKQYDINGDGALDRTEISKLSSLEKYDRDHDGKITLDEIIESLRTAPRAASEQSGMRFGGGFNGGSGQFGGGGFAGRQGNPAGGFGGGMIGPGPRPMMGIALFQALDTNSDGKLDAKEIAAADDVLKKLANSNGEITREDLAALMPPGAGAGGGAQGGFGGALLGGGAGQNPAGSLMSFDQIVKSLDRNGDGKLQKNELPPRFAERFEEFDNNHDGVLEESELKDILPRLARQLQQRGEGRRGGAPPARRPMRPEENKPESK